MRLRTAAVLVSAGMVLSAATPVPVTREGEYWVQTRSAPLAGAFETLRIVSRGPVVVRGFDRGSEFVLRTRVRARSEAEARRLLSEIGVRQSVSRGVATLNITHGPRPLAAAELSVTVPADTGVRVETEQGDVQVEGLADNAWVKTGAGEIRMDRIQGDATARTAGGEVRIGRVAGSIRCFSGGGSIQALLAGGESWFETAGGNIRLGEIRGPVHASTGGGNVQIGRARSSVVARSAGGRIEVEEAGGIVMAGNAGGSIQVGHAQSVRLEATGGSIRLRGSSGALRAASDVGSILAELMPGVRLQDSALSTGSGDITVFIPSNISLTIKALNESGRLGRIVSDFPEILIQTLQQESRMLAEGALNGGGPVLQLTSTGGTIYLRRVRQ